MAFDRVHAVVAIRPGNARPVTDHVRTVMWASSWYFFAGDRSIRVWRSQGTVTATTFERSLSFAREPASCAVITYWYRPEGTSRSVKATAGGRAEPTRTKSRPLSARYTM